MKFTSILTNLILENSRFQVLLDKFVKPIIKPTETPKKGVKGKKPKGLMDFEMLKAIKYVDFIFVLEEDFPQNAIESIKPNVLVKGEDWRGKNIAGANVVDRIEFIPLVEGLSTTNIIDN